SCNAKTSSGIELDLDMEVTPSLSVPESVEENGEINVTGFSSDIKLHFSGALDSLKNLINPFKGHVDHFNIEGDDQIVNAIGEGRVAIPSTEFADDAKFVEFNVAGKDTIVTAGTEDVEIVAGEILAQIDSPLGDIPATCTPDEKTVLATVEVEEPVEPEEPVDPEDPVDPEEPADPEDEEETPVVTGPLNYTCKAVASIGELEIDMEVEPTISVPDSVKPNKNINITEINTDIELDLSGSLNALKSLINPFEGNVDFINLVADGEDVNIVGEGGVAIPSTEFANDAESVAFSVDGNNTTITAGEEEGELLIVAGEILAQIGSPIGDIPANCLPDEENVIAVVQIDENAEDSDDLPEDPEDPENPEDPEDPGKPEKPGKPGKDGQDGEPGKDGQDGKPGKDGKN